ncbi:MAG: glycosyltransferase family A protein [Patescibacteria group bacterium]|nr:glycosyltransferase family A protein [Patescibacteria group bacterium]
MISIIIPIYNQPKKLQACLASIEAQTYGNYEIVLINDRSTTKLSSVLNLFIERFGLKLSIYNNQSNHGAPYSRNKGMRYAKGEYLLFCDADIIMKKIMLEKMHTVLQQNTDTSFVYSNHIFGWKKFRFWPFDAGKLKNIPYIHSTSLMKREAYPKEAWDESLRRLQDWDFWLRVVEGGHKGIWIDEFLFTIQTGGTMSAWLPRIFYKIFPFSLSVIKYNKAVETVKKKHNII